MNLRLFALTALLLTDTANLSSTSSQRDHNRHDSPTAATRTVPKANVRIINEDTAVARTMTTGHHRDLRRPQHDSRPLPYRGGA